MLSTLKTVSNFSCLIKRVLATQMPPKVPKISQRINLTLNKTISVFEPGLYIKIWSYLKFCFSLRLPALLADWRNENVGKHNVWKISDHFSECLVLHLFLMHHLPSLMTARNIGLTGGFANVRASKTEQPEHGALGEQWSYSVSSLWGKKCPNSGE